MDTDREKCLGVGCDEYLTNPIDRDLPLSTLYHFLSSKEKGEQFVQSWVI
ncbi:MAG: hypothetical protein ACWGMZ_04335 [Thermoguttaceae bacterium]